ncbi:hypothetical protein ACJX0J_022397 [Zea mays]
MSGSGSNMYFYYNIIKLKWHKELMAVGSIWHICAAMTTYPILTIFAFMFFFSIFFHLVLPYIDLPFLLLLDFVHVFFFCFIHVTLYFTKVIQISTAPYYYKYIEQHQPLNLEIQIIVAMGCILPFCLLHTIF